MEYGRYQLEKRLIDPKEIYAELKTINANESPLVNEYTLDVDDNYSILQFRNEHMVMYVHIKNNEYDRLCVYRKEIK